MTAPLKPASSTAWQILLLGLLGIPGILFIPLLLRWLPVEMMARILVMQVYVYYLVLLVQYGFFMSGPASLARASESVARFAVLWRSLRCKAVVFCGPVLLIFAVIVAFQWRGQDGYLLGFLLLLVAYALNSNWFLQASRDYASGVKYAALGVLLSCLFLLVLWGGSSLWPSMNLAWLAVGVLILPQTALGFGSAWRSLNHRSSSATSESQAMTLMRELKQGFPLVLGQFLALACTTLGTLVVGELADPETTAAYAATEKLFNFGATVLVGLYLAIYPRLTELHVADPDRYWQSLRWLLLAFAGVGLLVILTLSLWGQAIFGFYLGEGLAALIQPVLLPLGLWLGLCMAQQLLSGHLIAEQQGARSLWLNAIILFCTALIGGLCAWIKPIAWVWGMVSGQVLALLMLGWFYQQRLQLGLRG